MKPRPIALVSALVAVAALVFAAGAAAESPNVNSPATITGDAVVGAQLTAHNGTWLYADGTSCKDECAYTYEWQRCDEGVSNCSNIGASGRFYTVQAADAGSRLRVVETVTKHDCNAHGVDCRSVSKSAPSRATAIVPGSAPTAPAPTPPAAPQPQAPIPPTATSAPAISGIPMVDETLTATKGLWSGTAPLTVTLEWLRCDAAGANCETLGLGGDTYRVIRVDVGKTLRVRVTGANAAGRRTALSDPTGVVTELRPTEAKPSIAASAVLAPHRLTLASSTVAPRGVTPRSTIRIVVRVDDTRGFRVAGALVSVAALPRAAYRPAAEVTTDANGVATLLLTPTRRLDPKKTRTVKLVVTARRPGDRLVSPRGAVLRLALTVASR